MERNVKNISDPVPDNVPDTDTDVIPEKELSRHPSWNRHGGLVTLFSSRL